MLLDLMLSIAWPPRFRNRLAFFTMISAWLGWATSAKTTSTLDTNTAYSSGLLASPIIGETFTLYLETLSSRSLRDLAEKSRAQTWPLSPTMSETWLTGGPEGAPR